MTKRSQQPTETAPQCLIFGAIAYDTLASYDSHNNLTSSLQTSAPTASAGALNVKLTHLDEQFGGCAGNLAFGLAQAEQTPLVCAVVGEDFRPNYADHFERLAISARHLIHTPGLCARALIFTSANHEHQVTAFYPGPDLPSNYTRQIEATLARTTPWAAIQAPAAPETTLINAELSGAVPYRVWNPGQYASEFSKTQIGHMLQWSELLILNQLEWQWLQSNTAPKRLPPTIITNSAQPLTLLMNSKRWQLEVPQVAQATDPTGCGDALLAGLLSHLNGNPPTAHTHLLAALAHGCESAGACLASAGAQTYTART